jgi:hypothetical protein
MKTKIAAIILSLFSLTSSAETLEVPCNTEAYFQKKLKEYQEVAIGAGASTMTKDAVISVWVNQTTGAYTVLLYVDKNTVCAIDMGEKFKLRNLKQI